MGEKTYERLREVFLAACEVPAHERGKVIARACRGDEKLRREVEELLAQDADATDFLRPPGNGRGMPLPTTIDRYTIVRLIAEGGMGAVYEARQDNPARTVALKVIRPGIASAGARRRFEYEGQVLGLLQHDGIARIYESGVASTGEGPRPFFAMELVNGRPLLEHAAHGALDVRQRLELIARVCDAVHHAHQKGVIHRDLKPANILVVAEPGSSVGQPKVLDFGVARATDADLRPTTLRTGVGQLIGTVPYMSPEQASGERSNLDTRSDIYSLGVLGYELLSGRLPYDLDGLLVHEAVRVIRDVDPIPLGAIDRGLRGDVETIIAKALEKEPDRRYDSAAALAADLRRCLADEPITARPPSARYQLLKFARRNRPLLAGVATGLVLLVSGAAAATWGMLSAREGQEEALEARSESDEVTEFFVRMFESMDPELLGREVLVRDVLDEAAPRVATEFADRPRVAARLHEAMGGAYFGIGAFGESAQQHALVISLDDGHRVEESARWRAQFARALVEAGRLGEAAIVARDAVELARLSKASMHWHQYWRVCELVLAEVYYRQARYKEAQFLCSDLLNDPRMHADADRSLNMLVLSASIAIESGDTDLARQRIGAAIERWGSSPEQGGSAAVRLLALLPALHRISGDYDEAISTCEEAVEVASKHFGEDHKITLVAGHNRLRLLSAIGRHQNAVAGFEALIARERRVLGGEHYVTLSSINSLALLHAQLGRADEALPLYQEVLAARRRQLGDDHPHTVNSLTNIGMAYARLGAIEDAQEYLEEVVARCKSTYGAMHIRTGDALHNLAGIEHQRGNYAQALEHGRMALSITDEARGADHPESLATRGLVARFLGDVGRTSDAEVMYRSTIKGLRSTTAPHLLGDALLGLAKLLLANGRDSEARVLLEEAVGVLRESYGPDHRLTVQAMDRLRRVATGETRGHAAPEPAG